MEENRNEFRVVDLSDDPEKSEYIPRNESELRSILQSAQKQGSAYIDLISTDGNTLTIAMGRRLGVASYMESSGKPPYLCAVGPSWKEEKGSVEFDICGEPTPMPRSMCLPASRIMEVAVHFFATGELSKEVTWVARSSLRRE